MKKTKTEIAAPAAPKEQPAGLKKFNLAGIAAKPATGKPVKSYPVMPDPDGQVAVLVTSILERAAQVEALEGALELDKSELIVLAKQFYFSHYSGKMAVASSVEARNGAQVVRVGFSNSYRGTTDDAAILRVSGEKGAKFFKQSFELKIKGDLIPEASVEPLIGELALSAKALFKPTKEFHTARHTLFTPDENFAIDKVVPISASVKTKLGRGGSDDE